MISDRDIIFISSIEWNFLWQMNQEIASRLARAGNRVLYIENTGVRSPGLRDASRVMLRLRHWTTSLSSQGVREVAPNVFVVSPLVLPPFGSFWRGMINRRILLKLVKRVVRSLGMRDPLIWIYLPTDTAIGLIEMMSTSRSVIVYHCIADFAELTTQPRRLRQSEATLVEMSDLIFANCTQLAEHCRQWSNNVHTFPPGVNLAAFPANQVGGGDGHAQRSLLLPGNGARGSFSKPVIGYIGGLHRFVDYDLLARLARARPEWSWVFVGAVTAPVGELADLSNVHLLGQQPHEDLVHYVRNFDVCLIPYLNNSATATVVPVKLNEYLAVGKPVVSTELPTMRDFNRQHEGLMTTASRPECFLQAIEQALSSANDEDLIKRRREVAALSEWQARLNEMSKLIDKKTKEKCAGATPKTVSS